jgi:hypothetical protein
MLIARFQIPREETNMKRFLVLYQSAVSAEEQMAHATPEQAKAGMDAWMAWAGKAAASIIELGSPLGSGLHVESGSSTTGQTQIRGYSILQASTGDEIARLLEGHAHLMMPGASIEVLEALPMPGM